MFLLSRLLPFFLVSALGFACARKALFPDGFTAVANRLVFYLALPATLFKSMAGQPDGAALSVLPAVAVAVAIPASCLCALGLTRLLYGPGPCAGRATWVQCSLHSNQGIGLPVTLFLCGETGMLAAGPMFAALIVVQNLFSTLVYHSYGAGGWRGKSGRALLRGLGANPAVLGTLAGVLCYEARLPLPAWLLDAVGIVAGLFLPLALLAVGVHLAGWRREAAADSRVADLLFLYGHKVVLLPALGILAGFLLGLNALEQLVVVIGLSSPTALVSGIFAAEMGGEPQKAAAIIGLTHFLCPLSYALWVTVLS